MGPRRARYSLNIRAHRRTNPGLFHRLDPRTLGQQHGRRTSKSASSSSPSSSSSSSTSCIQSAANFSMWAIGKGAAGTKGQGNSEKVHEHDLQCTVHFYTQGEILPSTAKVPPIKPMLSLYEPAQRPSAGNPSRALQQKMKLFSSQHFCCGSSSQTYSSIPPNHTFHIC